MTTFQAVTYFTQSSKIPQLSKSRYEKPRKIGDSSSQAKKVDISLASSNSANYLLPSTSYHGTTKSNLKYNSSPFSQTPTYHPPSIQPPKYNGLKTHDGNGWVAAPGNSTSSNNKVIVPGSSLTSKLLYLELKLLHKMESFRENFVDHIRTEKTVVREFMAEFIGTFFLLLIGSSANVQQAAAEGSIVSTQLAWGLGFAFAVYLAASVSGAHLNPAISFAALFNGDLSPPRFILFVFAQLLGAFSGTSIAYLGHLDDIKYLEGLSGMANGTWKTTRLFVTYPSDHITEIGSLFDQIIGTAILASCLSLIADRKHRIPSGVVPLLAGLVMSMVAMTFGANGGFAINPARDFSPRLFLLCVGYGWSVFSANEYYFWIPIIGPIVGALLGSWIYKLFVGIHGLNENVEITGGKPYPRDDRGYKEYSSNASVGMDNLVSFHNLPR